MVAAVSTPLNPKTTPAPSNQYPHRHPPRRPLLPSDPDNALPPPHRPKSRDVTSRYMSSSSSSSTAKRSPSPSPLISRPAGSAMATPMTAHPSTVKRSLSVDRKRIATPRSSGVEVSNAQRMLITSARSLSVSFQGQSFSLQVSKAKPAPTPISTRKGTPERRKGTPIPARGVDHGENSRPVEQQRWPGRLRTPNSMTRSMDCGDITGSRVNSNVVRALQSSLVDNRPSVERLSSDSSNVDSEKRFVVRGLETRSNSDTESVSSGSTAESTGNAGGGQGYRSGSVSIPARSWQENNSRLRRQPEPTSPVSRTVGLKGAGPPPKKLGIDSPVSSPKGGVRSASPMRGGALRPASPSKMVTPAATQSAMRGFSPSRMRNNVGAVVNSNLANVNNTPSILSFAADIRRTRSGEHRLAEVHALRILYNRLLQWRFVNARTDSALSAQRLNAETSLHNSSLKTSELLESVRAKRTELQWRRQTLNLISILKGQMASLDEMARIDQDFACSLTGANEALQASTLRLPVVGGARADVQKVKDAVCSAVDVMQAMASSICLLLSKVGGVNSLVVELANVAAKERAMLGQCNYLLSAISALQAEECSLRTHILQVERDCSG
ncbi:hypothetical protein M5689_016785 [Euphorbia peplus]|nr:hypothetical protein M5689_016785 [Euphorbia peplus]